MDPISHIIYNLVRMSLYPTLFRWTCNHITPPYILGRFSETLKPLVISLLVIALLHFTPTAQPLDFYSLPPYPSTKIPRTRRR